MRELLERLFDLMTPPVLADELGYLGTHAYVVTDWQPGPTSWRMVNMGDLAEEPLHRTRTVKGPLVFSADMGIPLFEGEKTPPITAGQETADASDFIDRWAETLQSGGYPS